MEMTEYPKRRTVTWIDDETREVVGEAEYIHHAEYDALVAERDALRADRDKAATLLSLYVKRAEAAEQALAERDATITDLIQKADVDEWID
jgi:hypothetical protein